eukprot:CAMPEP_0115003982 /NCGR_PEP_ID=MMETSP0216-20121206/18935_1 /TAXON_ID=223996 /ORGANISM="Protocruzia adherens, Strain Boccale" /LENGTH=285 /DNA_ID=CAMNT_0002369891 /DNA_START=194 /DNA_END=1054 /DNA_ORIENTATION=+
MGATTGGRDLFSTTATATAAASTETPVVDTALVPAGDKCKCNNGVDMSNEEIQQLVMFREAFLGRLKDSDISVSAAKDLMFPDFEPSGKTVTIQKIDEDANLPAVTNQNVDDAEMVLKSNIFLGKLAKKEAEKASAHNSFTLDFFDEEETMEVGKTPITLKTIDSDNESESTVGSLVPTTNLSQKVNSMYCPSGQLYRNGINSTPGAKTFRPSGEDDSEIVDAYLDNGDYLHLILPANKISHNFETSGANFNDTADNYDPSYVEIGCKVFEVRHIQRDIDSQMKF